MSAISKYGYAQDGYWRLYRSHHWLGREPNHLLNKVSDMGSQNMEKRTHET
jgi:hypothetical protein